MSTKRQAGNIFTCPLLVSDTMLYLYSIIPLLQASTIVSDENKYEVWIIILCFTRNGEDYNRYWRKHTMKNIIIHQWRDWLLEKIADDEYELIQKNTQSVQTIVANDTMEAENQCRQIIRDYNVEGVTTQ